MTIKIEFPADRKDIALAIGKALTEIGQLQSLIDSDPLVEQAGDDLEDPCPFEAKAADLGAPKSSLKIAAHNIKRAIGVIQLNAPDQTDDELLRRLTGLPWDSTPEQFAQMLGLGREVGNADTVTHEQKEGPAHAASDGAEVDEKGVPFNGELCGKAAIPFYGSGKKKGQWKKRQGVDEDAYDEWYADALLGAKVETVEDTAQTETTSDSNVAANAFGNQQQAAAGEDVPQDAGQLMKWVSEQQAAGNINQQQVTAAYTALQLPFDAIMNPAYPVAQNCAAIYNHLKGQIG